MNIKCITFWRVSFLSLHVSFTSSSIISSTPLFLLTATQILFATGDTLAQHAVEGVPAHDPARTARMTAYGGLVFGPGATLWYSKALTRINLSSKPATILARVLTDQTVFASTNLALFLSSMTILEGKGIEGAKEKLRKSYLPALKVNWMVWPAVQAGNFAVVPLEHRVLVVNVVSIGWNCYLSYVNSGGGQNPKAGMKYPPDA